MSIHRIIDNLFCKDPRLFQQSSSMVNEENPWAGLSSYQDPEKCAHPLKFCGREEESYDVTHLITNNIFVTLYGKSGTGKTSLLNAGVFPMLRAKHYMPINVRLAMDARNKSFQEVIIRKLDLALLEKGGERKTIEVVPPIADEKAPEYLWNFFARNRFFDKEGRAVFPVFVLDQFEEIFRNRRLETEDLLCQIAYLMDESHLLSPRLVDGELYEYDFNFRFVVAIREDDLYRLEDSIDNCYLREMKNCRFRLHSLSEKGARDAILIPGDGLFSKDGQEDIVHHIIKIASSKDNGNINTNILSLICSRIYVELKKSGSKCIDWPLVQRFIEGNPFDDFYREATRTCTNKEKAYIEKRFVDSSGRRNSVSEHDFFKHVKNGDRLLEGSSRILQRTSVSTDAENYRIELIHDSFCGPLEALKLKRERRRQMLNVLWCVILFLAIVGLFQAYYNSTSVQNEKIRKLKVEIKKCDKQILQLKKNILSYENRLSDTEQRYRDSIQIVRIETQEREREVLLKERIKMKRNVDDALIEIRRTFDEIYEFYQKNPYKKSYPQLPDYLKTQDEARSYGELMWKKHSKNAMQKLEDVKYRMEEFSNSLKIDYYKENKSK